MATCARTVDKLRTITYRTVYKFPGHSTDVVWSQSGVEKNNYDAANLKSLFSPWDSNLPCTLTAIFYHPKQKVKDLFDFCSLHYRNMDGGAGCIAPKNK